MLNFVVEIACRSTFAFRCNDQNFMVVRLAVLKKSQDRVRDPVNLGQEGFCNHSYAQLLGTFEFEHGKRVTGEEVSSPICGLQVPE